MELIYLVKVFLVLVAEAVDKSVEAVLAVSEGALQVAALDSVRWVSPVFMVLAVVGGRRRSCPWCAVPALQRSAVGW